MQSISLGENSRIDRDKTCKDKGVCDFNPVSTIDNTVILKIKQIENGKIPEYANPGEDSGMDLFCNETSDIILEPRKTYAFKTGIAIELHQDYEAQIRSRSGLALKNQIIVANSPGTIDSGYRDEVKVILINLGDENFTVKPGMKIAQMVIQFVAKLKPHHIKIVDFLSDSKRGLNGFGSTGI